MFIKVEKSIFEKKEAALAFWNGYCIEKHLALVTGVFFCIENETVRYQAQIFIKGFKYCPFSPPAFRCTRCGGLIGSR